jgi:hypothetical protein
LWKKCLEEFTLCGSGNQVNLKGSKKFFAEEIKRRTTVRRYRDRRWISEDRTKK